jgi:CBS domain-containing protein
MDVQDVMTRSVCVVAPETSLRDVAALLVEHGISGMPVCDAEGAVVGVVSETDILYKERGAQDGDGLLARFGRVSASRDAAKATARTAGEAMTSPPITITAYRPIAAAARLMLEHGVNRLPVVKNDRLVGIVTRADLVRAFDRTDAEIENEIRSRSPSITERFGSAARSRAGWTPSCSRSSRPACPASSACSPRSRGVSTTRGGRRRAPPRGCRPAQPGASSSTPSARA